MIGDHYLRVQRWSPNFDVETKAIRSLPVWVRFPILPVEYYSKKWLKRAGDKIGKTIKIDDATRAITHDKFARVCVEIDLGRPLKFG